MLSRELKYKLRKLGRKWFTPLAQGTIAVIIAALSVFFWTRDIGQKADLYVLQKFFEFRGARPAPQDVIIVAIDDHSYMKLEASTRQPFPRKFIAEAMEKIVQAKPRAVIIDAKIPKENLDPEADKKLEAALRAGPTSIWSGAIPDKESGSTVSNPTADLIMPSDQKFRDAAKMELPMTLAQQQGQISRIATNAKNPANLSELIPTSRPLTELAGYKLETPGPRDLINYYGAKGTVKRLPVYELTDGFFQPQVLEQLKDKVVLVGFQSIARERGQIDKDELIVPVSDDPMFGVEIHATVVGNLLDKSWITRKDLITELYFLFLVSFIFALVGIAITPDKSLPLIFFMSGALVTAGYYLFAASHFWLAGLGTIVSTAIFTMICSALYHFVIIKRVKNYIDKTFNFELERQT